MHYVCHCLNLLKKGGRLGQYASVSKKTKRDWLIDKELGGNKREE